MHNPNTSGVYEVKYQEQEGRLQIGKASNLRRRIRQGLVEGTAKHSSGTGIRKQEELDKIDVRWAETERRSAVEEDLQRQHYNRPAKLPKFVRHI